MGSRREVAGPHEDGLDTRESPEQRFGKVLRFIREVNGIRAQAELARLADVPASLISVVESGKRPATDKYIRAIAPELAENPRTLILLRNWLRRELPDLIATVDRLVDPYLAGDTRSLQWWDPRNPQDRQRGLAGAITDEFYDHWGSDEEVTNPSAGGEMPASAVAVDGKASGVELQQRRLLEDLAQTAEELTEEELQRVLAFIAGMKAARP